MKSEDAYVGQRVVAIENIDGMIPKGYAGTIYWVDNSDDRAIVTWDKLGGGHDGYSAAPLYRKYVKVNSYSCWNVPWAYVSPLEPAIQIEIL